MRMNGLLTACAGLMGAAGVALAARAAHGGNDAGLMSAAMFLLIHAAALPELAAVRGDGAAGKTMGLALAVLIAGTCLFSGDLALRGLAGAKLFANAAPIGGMAMILGWLAVAMSGLAGALTPGK